MSTYTLQRTRPVDLGLLDTITVSLTVLVVVGMAIQLKPRSARVAQA